GSRGGALLIGIKISDRALHIDDRLRQRRSIQHPLLLVLYASLRKSRARYSVVQRHLERQHRGVVVIAEAPQAIERVAVDSAERQFTARECRGGWSRIGN